ncbi:MAG: hypothetical protein HZB29_08775 [Nitrospinae bacterium]|nr:hypothetical protein [Nitrospinota bacterium]
MSIIEDTLTKLQKQRSGTASTGGAYIPPLPQLGGEDGDRKPGGKRKTAYIAFIAVMLVLGAGLWVGLDFLQKEKMKVAQKLAAQSTPLPLAPAAPVQQPEQAIAPPAEQAQPATVEQTPAAPVAAPQPKPEAVTAVAVKEMVKPQPSAPTVTAQQPSPSQTKQAEPVIENIEWLEGGWKAVSDKGLGEAPAIWEAGLRSMPEKRFVFLIATYTNEEAALKKLYQVGRELGAFTVKGTYERRPSYYLLAVPPDGKIKDAQAAISAKLHVETVKGNPAKLILTKIDHNKVFAEANIAQEPMAPGAGAGKKMKGPVKEPKSRVKAPSKLSPQAEERVLKAKKLLASGSYDLASETLQPLFAAPMENWEPCLLMGTAYLGQGKLDAAKNYLDQGLALDPAQPRLLVQRAVVEQQKNSNESALQYLKEAEKTAPAMPEVWLNTAYSSDALGKKDEALNAYRKFIATSEERSGAYKKQRSEALKRIEALSR